MRRPAHLALIGLVAAASCSGPPTALETDGPQLSIEDAVHNGGNERFFWLPPMVASPAYAGVFDGGLSPVVEICEWTGTACVLPLLAAYTTTSGPGGESVSVALDDEHYKVNWHTNQFGLDAAKTYRIVAKVDGQELGHADVDVVSSGSQLKNVDTNEYIPLKDGRTLPVKFRIEAGVVPSGVTIDATALTAAAVDLRGPSGEIGFLPVAAPISIPPDPGTYTIADRFLGNPIPFSVTASGAVDYDPIYDPIFSGRGSSTLTVLGHQYTIDATALSATHIQLAGIGHFVTPTPAVVTELPGSKKVQDSASPEFMSYELTNAGLVTYHPDLEPFVDGNGTGTLTLVGYEYTVDATALSAPNIQLASIGYFSTSTPAVARGLPGTKKVQEQSSPEFVSFELTTTGAITYAPAVDAFADGEGTATLTLVGFEIDVDATLMTPQSYMINGVASFLSTTIETLVFLPGSKGFTSTDLTFPFTVDSLGKLDYASGLDVRVSGRGGTSLVILF